MTSAAKIALGSGIAAVLIIGGRFGMIYRANHQSGPVAATAVEEPKLADDDIVMASLHKERPDSLKDERSLIGKPLWVSAGGQLDYYKYAGHHVDYSHPVGSLLGAEEILVKDVYEQKAPATGRAVFRFPAGERHVLLVFTRPKSTEPDAEFATPVGNYADGSYTLSNDDIFFYEDPHVLYKHWSPEMWAHIDKHEPALGMTENQAMMALGEVTIPHGDKIGERSVTFDDNEHPVTLEFSGGKAVKITQGS